MPVTFVDTNVLLYAVSTAPEERPKAVAARAILDRTDLALSVQVLQEFYVQATRAGRRDPLTRGQASALLEAWLRFEVQDVTVPLMRSAVETGARYRISYWDAAVIEAARMTGCRTVLSEDLADGSDFGGVRVMNPFGPSGTGA
jgi:predicted nucleic acid-binding protein